MRWRDIISENQEISWKAPRYSDHEVVWVDVDKIDASWAQDSNHYINGPQHPNAIGKRIKGFGDWLSTASEPVEMSVLSLDHYDGIYFENGRHRFVWMKSHGATSLPVMVPTEQAEEIQRRFGSGSHHTTVQV